MPAATALERIADETLELHELAEQVLIRLAAGETIGTGEHALFFRLGWDETRIKVEAERIKTVRRLQAEAGTTAERDKASASATAAEAKHDKQAPALRAQVAELEAQIRKLASDAESKRRRAEALDRAAEQLRETRYLPEHVRQHHKHLRKQTVEPLDVRLKQAESRVKTIKLMSDIEPTIANLQHHRDADGRQPWLYRDENDRWQLNAQAWLAYVAELHAELPDLQAAVDELTPAVAQAEAEVDAFLNYYIE